MSLLINSTTLGNIIITLGSVFSCITSFVNSHGIKLQESLSLVKRKFATDIDSAENARQEAEILVQKSSRGVSCRSHRSNSDY